MHIAGSSRYGKILGGKEIVRHNFDVHPANYAYTEPVRTVDHNEVVKGIGGAVPLESVDCRVSILESDE